MLCRNVLLTAEGRNWSVIPSPKPLIEKYISCKDPEQAFSTTREPLAEAELLSAILPEETEFTHSSKDLAFSWNFPLRYVSAKTFPQCCEAGDVCTGCSS